MACNTPPIKTIRTARRLLFTLGGPAASATQDFVVTEPDIEQIAALLDQLRVTLQVENRTQELKVTVYYQTSADGQVWSAKTNILSDYTANGTITSAWPSNSNWDRALRVGVTVAQGNSSSDRQMAYVQLVLDFRLVSGCWPIPTLP